MRSITTPPTVTVAKAIHYRPAISLVMPFEPKMNGQGALSILLKTACRKIEKQLLNEYPADTVLLMMAKLNNIIAHLNFGTHKKSIAIYLSPVFEKVIYLDIPVEEKIFIDGAFDIRDLLHCKKPMHQYLVLHLCGKHSRIFIGSENNFVNIVSAPAQSTAEPGHDLPEKTAEVSAIPDLSEIQAERFLRQVDKSLDIILQAYPLPLFVTGSQKILAHFKKLTIHGKSVVDYVYGDYCHATEKELSNILSPHVKDWNTVMEKDIRNRMAQAAGAGKLVSGLNNVWSEAHRGHGQLLLVEKNYLYAAGNDTHGETISKKVSNYHSFSCVRNTVDDVIEEVLQNGGDVEFASASVLKGHDHIALINYY